MCKKTILNRFKNMLGSLPNPGRSTGDVSEVSKKMNAQQKQNTSQIWDKAKQKLSRTQQILRDKGDMLRTSINEKSEEISQNLHKKGKQLGKQIEGNISSIRNSAREISGDVIKNMSKKSEDVVNFAYLKSQGVGKSVQETAENVLKEAKERGLKIGDETSKIFKQKSEEALKQGKIFYEKTKNSPVVEKIVKDVKQQQKGFLKAIYWRILFGVGFIVAIYGFSSSIPKQIRKYVSEKSDKKEIQQVK